VVLSITFVKNKGLTPFLLNHLKEEMMKRKVSLIGIIVLVVVAISAVYLKGRYDASNAKGPQLVSEAQAAGGVVKDPKGAAPDRYVYYPGTEELGPDEIRVFAAGTGMPAARLGQAATSWLIELGNGDKFLFDIGTGSMANTAALMIPYDYLDKVFLSHLHTDHWGDLDALWAGGWTAGRTEALKVWGPSGARSEMGTKYALENFKRTFNWDWATRAARLNGVPGEIEIHEFDYRGENQVVYQANGVTIRSWPAVHTGDGPVSYSLEWNGMKVVIGGDSAPNKWYIDYAKNADIAIHECFHTPEQMAKLYNQAPAVALWLSTQGHTSPQAFGKIMSTIKPRHAIGYHFFNEEATRYAIYDGVRETYDGPLSMATDRMVWNITKEKIVERMAVITEEAWAVRGIKPPPRREKPPTSEFTKWILDGRWDVSDAQGKLIKDYANEYGVDVKKIFEK
jgi:ribonuclease Z